MYRIWYWATVDRESDGRFIASIPDLGDLAAYGDTDKDAVAHVTDLAGERVRAVWTTAKRFLRGATPRKCRATSDDPRRSAELSSRWKLGAGTRGQLRPITCRFELNRSKAGKQSGNA